VGSVFEEMAKSVPVNTKKFDRIEEIPIERFIRDVLPTTQRIEVLLENRLSPNLVSLIAPTEQSVSGMFKWNNGFSWAYNGNITDSMKERVKSFGGNVTGVLRFSIQWNTNKDNFDDLDAHCVEPTGNHIYFVKKHYHKSSGDLDVDIIDPKSQTKDGIAVENITYQNLARMPDGVYKFFVHCYNSRGAKSGFTAEIEFNGEIYSFSYGPALHWNENIQVAEVTLKNGQFQIKELIPSQASSKKVWNLDSNQFHPVSMIMYSPNHWDGQGVGNRHVFFMLQNCINEDTPNGFFNEYLKEDLLKHKRVFEALGSRMRVEPSDDQLSGVGFSTTQKNYIVVRVKGSVDRILKVVV
jgi:hypothetical protein